MIIIFASQRNILILDISCNNICYKAKRVNIRKITLLFLCLYLLTSCHKTNEKQPKEIKKADSLFNNKDYESAKQIYDSFYLSNPDNEHVIKQLKVVDSILELDRKNAHYNEIIKIADSLFDNRKYEEAYYVYESAANLKPQDFFSVERIEEIEAILYSSSEYIEEPYHIIVGSFAVEANAIRLRNKLQDDGYNAQFIPRKNGTMKAVTFTSHPNIHDAYNNLNKAKKVVHEDAWVLYNLFE